MNRFSADTLDLSRYPAPLAIRDIDYEGLMTERKARLVDLFAAAGIDYDVDGLETDTAVILEETDAYRELLAYAAINDAVRAVMVAFATGSDLDHLGGGFGVIRRTILPATTTTAAVIEGDEEFRRRVLLAPEAYAAAGPRGAYVYHALTSHPDVLNVDVWKEAPGRVVVAVQSRQGDGLASAALLQAVREYLNSEKIRPLTDVVTVRSVKNFAYTIDVEAFVLPGPDRDAVKTSIVESLTAMAAARRTPARDVPRSAVFTAASIGPVDKVIVNKPTADVARDYGEVAVLSATPTVRVTTYAG